MAAIPAKVVAVGNFRLKGDRGCIPEILDDHFRQTVHVQRLDLSQWDDHKDRRRLFGIGFRQAVPMSVEAPGMPEGLKLTSKKLQWVDTVVEAAQVAAPWEQFVKLHMELREGLSSTASMQERRSEILVELAAISIRRGLAQVEARSPWKNNHEVRFTGLVKLDTLAATVRGKSLVTELIELDAKLSCEC